MRILHLAAYPLFSGPIPPTLALVLAQRRLGHTVWLACDARRGNFNGFEEAVGPHLEDLALAPPLPHALTLSTHASCKQHWADYHALRDLMRAKSVDVVHTHLSHDHALTALGRCAQVPIIRTVHAARALRRRVGQAWLMRRADQLIVRCAQHARRLEATFPKAQGRVTTILGSVEATRWRMSKLAAEQSRKALRERFGIADDASVLGHVALIAGRGQQELIDALSCDGPSPHSPLHVLFVGDGTHAKALQAQVWRRKLGHRVHFTGYLTAVQLKEAYAAMDAALVMQAGNDATARAALEAMAVGLPVLAPAADALGELVDEETGYVLAARTVQALRQGLNRWLNDVGQGRVRGAAGKRRVDRERDVPREAYATLAVYDRAIAQSARSA